MLSYVELLGAGGSLGLSTDDRISGVTITSGANLGSPINTGPTFGRLSPDITFLGGNLGTWGPTYPKYQFTRTFDLTFSNGSKTGLGGAIAFETDATSFDIRMYALGGNSRFTLMIDGKVVPESRSFSLPNDGSVRWVNFDMSALGLSPGYHTYEFDFFAGVDFGGLAVQAGTDVRPLSDSGPRLVVLGDSFSEGTGSANDSEDFASIVARRLGIPDLWQSAFGGTGWVATNGSRPNLLDRIVPDGVDAEGDIYIVAMGISDNGNVFNNVVDSLTQLTQGRPLAKIFVVTGFNAQAPDAPIASKTNVNQQIRDAVALFPSVTLLDADGVSFAQSGSGNPDPAGHWTLGTWVSTQIERSLGIDGRVETYLSGDIVGPLFLKGFDPAETYTFTVLEDGNPSTRFEVVETGDAFPLLKLKSNEFIMVEPTSLQVRVVGSLGSDVTGDIAFGMIFPRFGDRNDNHIFGATTSVKIYGFEGVDYLIGSPEDDIIDAGPGNDKLDGGPGHDEMIGGPGNDIYWVDSIGDLVVEEVGEGYDIVMSSLDGYVLPANFEGLDLLGGALSGGGNDANNYLRGNGLNNKLFGRGGDDRIEGMSGRDLLDGGDDNDILDGGPDADTMIGGRGNDQYYVDDPLDAVRELSGEGGADWVFAAIDYTLPANVELLTIQGENGSGTGNNLANTIYGNATDNVLVGKGGKDTLYGYAGDDILNGGWGNDDLRGGGGTDTAVFAKVRASYTITPSGTLTYVRDNVTGELDTLRGIEILQFSDTSLPIA